MVKLLWLEVLRDITNEKMLKQKIVLQNKQHMDDINIAKKIQMSFYLQTSNKIRLAFRSYIILVKN